MKRQKSGLIIFWIGTLYIIIMGFITSYWVRGAYRHLSLEEVRETIWSYTNPLFGLWGVSIPLGAILVGIGLLIYVQAKSSHIWMFGIGTFAVVLIDILEKIWCFTITRTLAALIWYRRGFNFIILLWNTLVLGEKVCSA